MGPTKRSTEAKRAPRASAPKGQERPPDLCHRRGAERIAALARHSLRDLESLVPHAVAMLATDKMADVRAAAASVLARSKSDAALEGLLAGVDASDPATRGAVVSALGASQHSGAVGAVAARIERALDPHGDIDVALARGLIGSLGGRNDSEARRALMALYRLERTLPVRDAIIHALRHERDPAWIAELTRALDAPEETTRSAARSTLVWRGGAVAFDALAPLFEPERLERARGRAEARDTLLSLWCHDDRPGGGRPPDLDNDARWVPIAAAALAHEVLVHDALILLGQQRDARAVDALLAHIARRATEWRRAVTVLGTLGDLRATPVLAELLETAAEHEVWSVVSALGELGDPAALPALRARDARGDLPVDARRKLREVIAELTGSGGRGAGSP